MYSFYTCSVHEKFHFIGFVEPFLFAGEFSWCSGLYRQFWWYTIRTHIHGVFRRGLKLENYVVAAKILFELSVHIPLQCVGLRYHWYYLCAVFLFIHRIEHDQLCVYYHEEPFSINTKLLIYFSLSSFPILFLTQNLLYTKCNLSFNGTNLIICIKVIQYRPQANFGVLKPQM